jgi:ATP-dependent Clp protease protease subunit
MREYVKDIYDQVGGRVVPMVLDKTGRGSLQYDIVSRFLKDRVVILSEGFNDSSISLVALQLMFLDGQNNKEITLNIQSGGGAVYSLTFLMGVIVQLQSPLRTVVYGFAASCGFALFMMGDTRIINFNATIMNHQVSLGLPRSNLSDVKINFDSAKDLYNRTCILESAKSIVTHKGKKARYFPTKEDVQKLFRGGDCYMSAIDAVIAGVATDVQEPQKKDPFYVDTIRYMLENRSKEMIEYEKQRFGAELSLPTKIKARFDKLLKGKNNKK